MKSKITEVSIKLFEKKGFSATSIQDIVDEIGVTKGAFYYYYSSKEQLLMDIYKEYISDLLERQIQITNTTLTPKEKVTEMVSLLITDIVEKGPSARVFFREMRHLNEENQQEIRNIRKQILLNLKIVIEDGIDKGEFIDVDRPNMLSLGIVGILNWSYTWYDPNGEVSPRELAEIYTNFIFNGIEA